MSTKILEKIKVRKLFCIFEKYRKFQQLIFHKRKPGFRPPLSVRFRFAPSHCGLSPPAMSVRFRFAPSHCGLSPPAMPVRFPSSIPLRSISLRAFAPSHASSIPLRSISLRAFALYRKIRTAGLVQAQPAVRIFLCMAQCL